ncbi:hypothetical protein JZM32_07840 [Acinetobacter pittii]|uniref:hypothetical protein n=1 Tax=Acinetobacter pittii TaxID=48296 RepID=UPI00197F8501|nr:hypothetical protein [Acinetobacter pittii]MBN6527901.1 hypothetical protein [Acinetobacter pittii]
MAIESYDISVHSIKTLTDEKIKEMVNKKLSFIIEDIDRRKMSGAVKLVENIIEQKGLKCRVYSVGRSAALTGAVIPTPVTVLGGWAAGIAIGAHNLATWNPDYEIAKNIPFGTIRVNYKKS